LQEIVEVPELPHFIKGVMNLRSQVIPVMDMRTRFNLPPGEYNDRTVVMVLDVGSSPTGLVVDAVSEVVEIEDEDIDPPSTWQGGGNAVVKGLGKRGDGKVTIILDVRQILGDIQGVGQLPMGLT